MRDWIKQLRVREISILDFHLWLYFLIVTANRPLVVIHSDNVGFVIILSLLVSVVVGFN